MNKMLTARLLAVAALAGSAGLTVILSSGGPAAAKAPKPPVTVTCTALFGNATQQLESSCTGSSAKAKVTGSGVVTQPSGSTSVTYWTNNKTTDESFSETLVPGPGTCPTFLGVTASDVIKETATVTGGNSGLTVGQSGTSSVCLYEAGGNIAVVGMGPITI